MKFLYSVYAYTLLIILTIPLIPVLYLLPSQHAKRKATRWVSRCIFKLTGMALNTESLERIPDTPCVVVANHASYLDGVILMALLPPRFTFVIKREVVEVPLLHSLLRNKGSLFVERANKQQAALHLKKMYSRVESGESLAVFPEGTFRDYPGLRPFQKGAFAVAYKYDLPIVPIFILGARKALSADARLLTRTAFNISVKDVIEKPSDFDNVNALKDHVFNLFQTDTQVAEN